VRHEPTVAEMAALAAEYCADTGQDADAVVKKWRKEKITMHQPKGCKECDRTGYKGRMAVYELMVADAAVKRLVQARAPVADIAVAALAAGMRTLKQDGIEKVLAGHTDIAQVRAL
jgi:type II secretory ATPase GspE/PulE/Tfp pilus assembly ATPase PilB-like protein